jgi:hypothetical protein
VPTEAATRVALAPLGLVAEEHAIAHRELPLELGDTQLELLGALDVPGWGFVHQN